MNLAEALTDSDEEIAKSKRINGVATGIVTDNKDPDKLGRVKVKFPWLEEEAESDWAKVVSLMAGKERGAVFFPEVDDEVLVGFEQGDVNCPYVLGGLWNQEDKPPETNDDGKNNIRKITSRSGHEIIFNDDHEKKKEKIEIRTNAGHVITLDDSAGKERIEVKDKTGNNFLTIDSMQNAIAIEAAAKISIKAPMIELDASGMLTLKGGMVKIN
ncbi:MAG: phage tail protein [Nitrospirales bacterium]|nr:MAG: phage tail protein [Nitrospirales bacterium]